MNRRQLLTVFGLSMPISGCIEGTSDGATEENPQTSKATVTETPRNTATETKTPSPEGATPECWPSMCEGTKLVEVVVEDGFSGDVVLKAECRAEEFSIPSGESVKIDREEEAETCKIALSVNGEQVVSEYIEGYERGTLTVRSNGDVVDEWIVY